MEEHFNREVKQGRRLAADAARIADENASVKMASIRRVVSLWQLTAIWDR